MEATGRWLQAPRRVRRNSPRCRPAGQPKSSGTFQWTSPLRAPTCTGGLSLSSRFMAQTSCGRPSDDLARTSLSAAACMRIISCPRAKRRSACRNRDLVRGYGSVHLPTIPGSHELEVGCWSPHEFPIHPGPPQVLTTCSFHEPSRRANRTFSLWQVRMFRPVSSSTLQQFIGWIRGAPADYIDPKKPAMSSGRFVMFPASLLISRS